MRRCTQRADWTDERGSEPPITEITEAAEKRSLDLFSAVSVTSVISDHWVLIRVDPRNPCPSAFPLLSLLDNASLAYNGGRS